MKTLVMSGYLLQMHGDRAERHQAMTKPIRPAEIIAAVTWAIWRCKLLKWSPAWRRRQLWLKLNRAA